MFKGVFVCIQCMYAVYLQQEDDSDERCNQVNSIFDEYQAVLGLYIALTYTEYDAVELSNYYNTPA